MREQEYSCHREYLLIILVRKVSGFTTSRKADYKKINARTLEKILKILDSKTIFYSLVSLYFCLL